MAVITGGNVMPGGGLDSPLHNAGAPVNGTNEVQTVTVGGSPSAGTFKLTFDGHTTAPITWSATNGTLIANIDAALEALNNIGTGGVTTADVDLSSGVGNLTVTFAGTNVAKRAQPTMTADYSALTGGTVSVAETTPGVTATHLGAPKGAKLVDITNGVDYINTGTADAPTWTKTGTQS